MTLPSSFPPPARPDLGDRLLAAVAERDQPLADRLVQHWVHRRGLAALDSWMAGPLLASQGVEAARWLQEQAVGAPFEGVALGESPSRGVTSEQEPGLELETEWVSSFVQQRVQHPVQKAFEPIAQPISHLAWQETAVEDRQVAPIPAAVPAAVFRHPWSPLAVVPEGEPAPAPRALAPLRAWLPDAGFLPLAS